MFSTPLPHFNVVNVVTWSKQSRVNCKPQETTLSGERGGKYYLPACKPRNSRKMYNICLFQLLLSMIVDCLRPTGEYWPSVCFLRTSLRSVFTVTTWGEYSAVRPRRSVIKLYQKCKFVTLTFWAFLLKCHHVDYAERSLKMQKSTSWYKNVIT